jgi:hypothetical protein
MVATVGLISCSEPRESQPRGNGDSYPLGLDDVFEWRDHYGDLIGKPRETAIERFGDRFMEHSPGFLRWDASPRTTDRSVGIGLSAVDATGRIFLVKVFAKEDEALDPLEILKRAPLFTVETGTYSDSAINFMTAATKDKRNRFQFDVSDSGVTFHAVVFEDPEVAVAVPDRQVR